MYSFEGHFTLSYWKQLWLAGAQRILEEARMISTDGTCDKDWVTQHIESRVGRGVQWRHEIEQHKRLALSFRYVRILGGGFRPVSISDVNPCGHLRAEGDREIKGHSSITHAIAEANAASAIERRPGSDKPEQRVQAFLICAALQNREHFGRFHSVLPDFSDLFDELIFITDELSMNNGKVRADIVALGSRNGKFFPVFIELKNTRSLRKLRSQLDNANDWLWKNEQARKPFSRFLHAVSGVSLESICQDDEAAQKMIIWPKSPSGDEDETVNVARADGVLIVDFEIVGRKPHYVFRRKAL